MFEEVALITASAVLFVQMGLSGAIQETLHFRSRIASCPRCCAFWSVLAYSLLTRNGVVLSVAASFISAYAAMWLSLLYAALALLYNRAYESITETDGAPEDAEAGVDEPAPASADDEVPKM